MQQFLYMPRRDRKSMILIMTLEGQNIPRTFIKDFSILGFDKEKTETLEKFYQPYKMNYDIVIESANDFNSLKKRLLEKGFRNLPVTNQPIFTNWEKEKLKNSIKSQKIMLQKKKLTDRK